MFLGIWPWEGRALCIGSNAFTGSAERTGDLRPRVNVPDPRDSRFTSSRSPNGFGSWRLPAKPLHRTRPIAATLINPKSPWIAGASLVESIIEPLDASLKV